MDPFEILGEAMLYLVALIPVCRLGYEAGKRMLLKNQRLGVRLVPIIETAGAIIFIPTFFFCQSHFWIAVSSFPIWFSLSMMLGLDYDPDRWTDLV